MGVAGCRVLMKENPTSNGTGVGGQMEAKVASWEDCAKLWTRLKKPYFAERS